MKNKYSDTGIDGQVYDARLMKRLLAYLKPISHFVLLAVVLLFVVTALELAGPLVIKYGIDNHIALGKIDGLGKVVVLYLGILLITFLVRFFQGYLTEWIGQKVVFRIRTQLFNHLQNLDLKFIDSKPVGWMMTRITSDVQSLHEMLSSGLIAVFGDLLTLIGIVIILLVLNVKLALVTFTVVPIIFWVVFKFRSKVRNVFRIIREARADLNGFMQEHITGMRTVQLFVQEKATLKVFQKFNQIYRNAYLKIIRYFSLFFPSIHFLLALSTAIILLVGGIMIRDDILTWGAFIAFLQYAERFFRPIRDLSEKYNTMQAAMTAAERVFWLSDIKMDIEDPPESIKIAEIKGKIEFKSVHFEYISGEKVLDDVSFTVEPGETVAVVGATGAGKTTLISLLLRFWDISGGAIEIDGIDIRSFKQKELRALFGAVQQDVFLFSGSIGENVTLGDENRGGSRLESALDQANATHFIEKFPEGLNEAVGERGAMLSGGEKQLLAIARALAADNQLLLLDEATAAVDTETEFKIQQALEKLMKSKTTLVVAHRLSTIKSADKIIVMHKGKVRELGKHSELLKLDGIYAHLYQMQFV